MATEHGEVQFSWSFDEYEQHERGMGWYVTAGIVLAALLLTAFVARNFLFAVLLVMLAAVLYLRHTREPRGVACVVTDRGVEVDGHWYRFADVEYFRVAVPEHGAPVLIVDPKGWRLPTRVPIADDTDPAALRAFLAERVPEREEQADDEPGSEVLRKVLKL